MQFRSLLYQVIIVWQYKALNPFYLPQLLNYITEVSFETLIDCLFKGLFDVDGIREQLFIEAEAEIRDQVLNSWDQDGMFHKAFIAEGDDVGHSHSYKGLGYLGWERHGKDDELNLEWAGMIMVMVMLLILVMRVIWEQRFC
jgi:hypothetical protein